MKQKIVFLFILTLALLSFFLVGCSKSPEPGQYDAFAQCLTEKGVVMYGAEWCSHCKNQKKLFGNSFEYIAYLDCDRNRDACLEAGIRGYPTWSINGQNYPGEQSLSDLAFLSGCQI